MNDGALGGVLDGPAQNFMGKRSGVAFTQEDEADRVGNRAHIGPMEVNVGDTARGPLEIDEQGSDGIGNGSAPGMQHTIGPFAVSLEAETLGELGSISTLHLNKVDRRLVR